MSGGVAFGIEDLSAGYGERQVLQKLTLQLPARRISVILGPGGSGKSTLLRILAGDRKPDLEAEIPPHADRGNSGDAWVRGLVRQPSGALGFMGQTPRGLADTLGDVLGRGASPNDGGKGRALIDRVWDGQPRVGAMLEDWWSASFQDLPRGVAGLASLSLTLARDPKVLLLDEPTVDQPDDVKKLVAERLVRLREAGKSLVLVSHDLRMARTLADYLALIIKGRLVEAGDAAKVLTSPQSPRAEHFFRMGS